MKTKFPYLFITLALLSAFHLQLATVHAQGTAFTYQGQLQNNGAPANGSYDLQFILFNTNQFGSPATPILTNAAVPVNNGLFTTTLDFGGGVFAGTNFWIEISVRMNGSGAFSTLAPRQPITPAPYAITAENVIGLTVQQNTNGSPNVIEGSSVNYISNSVYGATIAGGGTANFSNSVTADFGTVGGGGNNTASGWASTVGGGAGNIASSPDGSATVGGGYYNTDSGDSGTVGGGDANTASGPYATISGGQQNLIQSSATGSDIAGGIQNVIQVGAAESVIGGGYFDIIQTNAHNSTIGGGAFNTIQASAQFSTIGGGWQNNNSGSGATIGGGEYNTSSNFASTVGGGYFNTSIGLEATVSGGVGNTSSGDYSTITGGADNVAAGRYSFAAGYFAQASHDGAFVWSDNSDISGVHFSSTGNNQFSVRAAGGVRFVTSGAGMTLDDQEVLANNQSSVTLSGTFNGTFSGTSSGNFSGNGSGLTLNAGNITSGTLADTRLSGNVALLNTSPVFAGDITMSGGAAYHHLALSGGNSIGYLYGSYPAFGDGIHLGYNYYADANGFPHVPDIGGGTSRITVGFGEIILAVGGVNTAPSSVRLDAATTGVTVYGTFNNLSDRNAKQDFAPVSSSQILEKVLQLPVSEWSYKVDAATRHVGPMGQDFYAAFNIGTDDKHIAPIDEGGVALAAIQGLNQKLEDRSRKLEMENTELKQRLDALEKKIRN